MRTRLRVIMNVIMKVAVSKKQHVLPTAGLRAWRGGEALETVST